MKESRQTLISKLSVVLLVSSTSAFVTRPRLAVPRWSLLSVDCKAVTQEEVAEELVAVDDTYYEWMSARGIETNGKLEFRPDARSGRGVYATGPIEAGEVIATVPWNLVIATPVEGSSSRRRSSNEFDDDDDDSDDNEVDSDGDASWVGRLAATALGYADADVFVNSALGLRPCVAAWRGGGWASEAGEPDPWYALDPIDNDDFNLLATGSDNDHNIYQKFGLKCHPVVHRATLRLGSICGTSPETNRDAIAVRGKVRASVHAYFCEVIVGGLMCVFLLNCLRVDCTVALACLLA